MMNKLIGNLAFKTFARQRTPFFYTNPLRSFAMKPGDKFPSAVVAIVTYDPDEGFNNEIVDINEYLERKSVVLVGYVGCFTPTCQA